MDGRQLRARRTRILAGEHDRRLRRAAIVVAIAHATVIVFFVAPTARTGYESRGLELSVADMLPEVHVPPPPEEIARPATPVVGSEETVEELTIAETSIVAYQTVSEAPVAGPPPAPAVQEERPGFAFTPYTVKPRCRENCEPERIVEHVRVLRLPGAECSLVVGIRIDLQGRVTATDVLRSSGVPACDAGVVEWALTTAWTTAYNRDQAVEVWIAQPVELVSR
ncbi:MAG TPA: hypothetical protein VM778_03640 [Gemmatimonadota bacterium]|nr:hypothetical protein [Gemmatimonadota bacterium]